MANWTDRDHEAEEVEGTLRWRVVADGPAGAVPGLLHLPARSVDVPIVMLGHGGGGGKDDPRWQAVARFLSLGIPAAVLCIDGPFHGERALNADGVDRDRLIRRALADPATVECFTGDWRAALDHVSNVEGVRLDDLGYVGFSMGTMLGVPVCAGLGGVRAAVFGVGGVFGAEVMRFVSETDVALIEKEADQFRRRGEMVVQGASRLADVDVLQLSMSGDEVFSMEGALSMFAAFPGPKRFVAWEGGHTELPHEALELAVWFLSRALSGSGAHLEERIGAY